MNKLKEPPRWRTWLGTVPAIGVALLPRLT